MQKNIITIQIIGSSQSRLIHYRSMISSMLNKEITIQLYDNPERSHLFKNKNPPNLLILLLDDITTSVFEQIGVLPLSARPTLFVISSSPNSQQMRLAMQAGARDYFTEPVDKEELHKALSRILFDLQRSHLHQGTLTTVINAKGGSGGSFIACNIGHIASIVSDRNIVLVDFDLQFGSQSLNLDLRPTHTIVEALNEVNGLDFDAINGYMSLHKSGLRLLSTAHEQIVLPQEIQVENLAKMLTLVISNYDHVIVDLPRLIDPVSITMLEQSNKIVIVVQQSLAHLRDAKRLTRILKTELNISERNIIIVVNRFDSKNVSMQLKDIQSALECSVLYSIPNDYERVAQSTNLGIPLFDYSRNAPITKSLLDLVESLEIAVNDEYKDKGFFKKLFGGAKV